MYRQSKNLRNYNACGYLTFDKNLRIYKDFMYFFILFLKKEMGKTRDF